MRRQNSSHGTPHSPATPPATSPPTSPATPTATHAATSTASAQAVPPLIAVGNPRRLDPETIETLIDCEQRGVPSVLWASSVEDLESAAAAVVTHVAVGDRALHGEALARFGPERALLAETPEAAVRQVKESMRTADPKAASGLAGLGRRAAAVASGVRRAASRAGRAAAAGARRRRGR